jgi:hypothetical protein
MLRPITITVTVAAALLVAGCVSRPTISSETFAPNELAALEAFFRYFFDHNVSGKQKNAAAYCLFLRQASSDVMNPDVTFLARFSDVGKPVRAGSRFREGHDLRFDAGIVARKSETHFQIKGGYFEGIMSGSHGLYDVRFERGAWKVSRNPDYIELITNRPNKALEPASTFGPAPAGAGAAPATVVAHARSYARL